MQMSREDHARIAAAIRAAEAKTSGEIVCVLARSSSDYAALPALWAALIALSVPWPLIAFTQWPVQWIYLAQLAVFVLALLLLSIGAARVALAPRNLRRAHAHRAAMEQFAIRGVTRTRGRTGVMIFVSLAERYARVCADDAIDAKVKQSDWQAVVNALICEVREDRLADGFVAAIQRSGEILATHFPRAENDSNELPDRIFII